jgi:hypothetical protein
MFVFNTDFTLQPVLLLLIYPTLFFLFLLSPASLKREGLGVRWDFIVRPAPNDSQIELLMMNLRTKAEC